LAGREVRSDGANDGCVVEGIGRLAGREVREERTDGWDANVASAGCGYGAGAVSVSVSWRFRKSRTDWKEVEIS
jgi:hypothetical protein